MVKDTNTSKQVETSSVGGSHVSSKWFKDGRYGWSKELIWICIGCGVEKCCWWKGNCEGKMRENHHVDKLSLEWTKSSSDENSQTKKDILDELCP